MKNHSTISKMLIIIFISLTSFIPVKSVKEKKEIKKTPFVLQCSCSTPLNPISTPSGSNVTLSWAAVSGAIYYSYGGSYNGGGFSGNTGGTGTSVTIPSNGGGTWQVRAICAGTCTNATCSSAPTSANSF